MTKQFTITEKNGQTTITTFAANEVSAIWKWDNESSWMQLSTEVEGTNYPTLEEATAAFAKIELPAEQITNDGSFGGKPNDNYKELVKYEITLDNEDVEGCTETELTEEVSYQLFGNPTTL